MKRFTKSWMFKACNLCIAFAGFAFWDKVSFFLFGEQEYPMG